MHQLTPAFLAYFGPLALTLCGIIERQQAVHRGQSEFYPSPSCGFALFLELELNLPFGV